MAVVIHIDGLVPYLEGQALQQTLLAGRIAERLPDTVLMLQHEPVITVGRAKGAPAHIHPNNPLPVVTVKRGGDVTLHAPGQWVAYPIIALTGDRRDLLDHMRRLERAVIDWLAEIGLTGQRDARNTGVWMPQESGPPLKVCAIGMACRQWVTWHGLALNIDLDMSLYQHLNPCGFSAEVMTRVMDWFDPSHDVNLSAAQLAHHLGQHLNLAPMQSHHYSAHHLEDLPDFLANCSTEL
jgi:lipoyl(octanoyl) transferase